MTSVMISIQPKWVAKILSGVKTIEVRKTAPKLNTPFKCYIYETQGKTDTPWIDEEGHMIFRGRGQVVAEFICDKIIPIRVFDNGTIQDWNFNNLKDSCVPYDEVVAYIGNNRNGHGWNISNLKVYDKPITIGNFKVRVINKVWSFRKKLERPPQSWCYVEELQ